MNKRFGKPEECVVQLEEKGWEERRRRKERCDRRELRWKRLCCGGGWGGAERLQRHVFMQNVGETDAREAGASYLVVLVFEAPRPGARIAACLLWQAIIILVSHRVFDASGFVGTEWQMEARSFMQDAMERDGHAKRESKWRVRRQ